MAIPTVHMILAGFLIQVAVTKIIWRNIYLPEKLHFGIFWLILIGLSLVVTFLTNIKTKNYKVYTFFLSLIVNFHGDYLGFYTVLSTMAQLSGDVKSTFDYETENSTITYATWGTFSYFRYFTGVKDHYILYTIPFMALASLLTTVHLFLRC